MDDIVFLLEFLQEAIITGIVIILICTFVKIIFWLCFYSNVKKIKRQNEEIIYQLNQLNNFSEEENEN